jgi:hypothetical protein
VSDTRRDDAEIEQMRWSVSESFATIEHMRAEQERWRQTRQQWEAEHELREKQARREDRRWQLYGLLVIAALVGASATVGAFVNQALQQPGQERSGVEP